MTREFPDELLSAFLDNELSPAERDQVEKHLATSEADRQLLTELKSLRSEVAALPQVAVPPDFTDRVVRAAVAEAEKHRPAAESPSLPARRSRGPWMIGAAVASAAALAACLLLVVQMRRTESERQPGPNVVIDAGKAVIDAGKAAIDTGNLIDASKSVEQIASASDQFLKTLRDAVPVEGEAMVLRIRVSKDVPLAQAIDAALADAGIASLASNLRSRAVPWQNAYRSSFDAKQSAADSIVAAADAVFIEAPLNSVEQVFTNLSAHVKQPWQLNADGTLTLASASRNDGPEGEGNTTPRAFAQRLNASLFRLEKKLAASANAAASASPASPQQLVRVLLLVETE